MSKLIYDERKKVKILEECIDYYISRAKHHEKTSKKPAHLDRAMAGAILWSLEIVYKYYGITEEEDKCTISNSED